MYKATILYCNKILYFLVVSPLVTFITENQAYNRRDDVTLNCSALGGPDLFYRWQANASYLAGENSSTLMLSNVDASDGGDYTCVVFNSAGNTSATTSVFILPYFTVQPDDAGITNGSSISLTCQAEAFPSPSYEWIQVGGSIRSGLSVGSEVLVFDPLLFGDEGDYVCNVTSAETVISSNTVTLSGKFLLYILMKWKLMQWEPLFFLWYLFQCGYKDNFLA